MNQSKVLNVDITGNQESRETSDSKNTYARSPSTRTGDTTSWISRARITQNYRLVWLNSNIDEINNDHSITELEEVVDAVQTFMDIDKCIDFITNIKEEKIFMIISGEFGQTTVPIVHDIAQINCVYILSEHKALHEEWGQEWSKVKGVFTDITSICKALKQAARECDQNLVSISVAKSTDGTSKENLDRLDQSFMYTQILKEILLTIDFQEENIHEFVTYCREQFVGNNAALKNIDKFEKEYREHEPIWWYTSQSFLYSMLNRALRLIEVELIIKLGFFVHDLHNQITALHTKQYDEHHHLDSFIVYRGQDLSRTDFDQLKKTPGGLMSFNNFLSTSFDRAVSLDFAKINQKILI
jgi:hypothetical protein